MLQENPALMLALAVMGFVALGGLFGSLLSWIWIASRATSGLPAVALQRPWEPRRWALVDLAVVALSLIVVPSVFVVFVRQALGQQQIAGSDPGLDDMAIGGLATLVCVGLAAIWIWLRYGASASHLGFRFFGWWTLGSGLLVGLAVIPLIFLMNAVVALTSSVPYEHPLIDTASESATLSGYLMACFAAVIAAPIAEEFLFRSLIQGWLQSIPFKSAWDTLVGTDRPSMMNSKDGGALLEGHGHETPTVEEVVSSDATADETVTRNASGLEMGSGLPHGTETGRESYLAENPYATPKSLHDELAQGTEPPRIATDGPIPPIWPSVITGILFGVAHWQYGLSWIPLCVLGTVLGLVYRQTHSIWPCVLIHMMMNGFAMLALGVTILMKSAGA